MTSVRLSRSAALRGSLRLPGDKSISHRGLLFGALARGTTRVTGLLESLDLQATRGCLERLGVEIRNLGPASVEIRGSGFRGLRPPGSELDCLNSGTTLRLLMGILAGQGFDATLTGDASLRRRPMRRVQAPLSQMGARIELTEGERAPARIRGTPELRPIRYELPIASAQIKSAILLAGLGIDGETTVTGRIDGRDHTERLLPAFGARVELGTGSVTVRGGGELHGADVRVPGDPSTAAFWLGAAAIVEGSEVELRDVSLNPTRLGFARALRRMGAAIELEETGREAEPRGSMRARHSELRGTEVPEQEVPSLIDELPLLAVLATQARGRTEVRGASELRVKESDRIEAIGRGLRAMGAEVELREDGFAIEGPQKLRGAEIDPEGDHRIAMAFSVAALVAEGETRILEPECVAVSYPGFFGTLEELRRG